MLWTSSGVQVLSGQHLRRAPTIGALGDNCESWQHVVFIVHRSIMPI